MRQWIEYAVENYRGKNSFGFQLVKDLKERQIIQAIERYARGVKPEEVVALMDTSVFRSGKTGFLLTERYLYSDKYKEDGPVSLMFLKAVSVRPENNSCCVLTFEDDSTRDVDISVFLDVVDVLRLIIEQRIEHEQDADAAETEGSTQEGTAKKESQGEKDGLRSPGRDHTGASMGMKDSKDHAGTEESRTVFEDSAEEFLRTVRAEASVRDAQEAQKPLEGTEESSLNDILRTDRAGDFGKGDMTEESSSKDIFMPDESGNSKEDAIAAKEVSMPDEADKPSGYTGITVESVRPAEHMSFGGDEKPENTESIRSSEEYGDLEGVRGAGGHEVPDLPIEIIPVDEFEESGESEESREERWLAEFSPSGESGDLILEEEPDTVQEKEELEAAKEEAAGKNEETGGEGRKEEAPDGPEESYEEIVRKAEAGDRAAMFRAAELCFAGQQEDTKQAEDTNQLQDMKKALKWFRESARLEYVPAMLRMMHFYREGEQVKKNLTLSLSWAKKAAATGDSKGQYALIDSYLYGLDGKQDTRAGLALLAKMAEQGDESAKRTADEVLNKIKEAKEQFDAGIKNPSTASGYYEMGMYCLKGDGFYNYPKEAVRYLQKAAEKEHVHAEYQLALAYHTGEGVRKDEDECIRWLEKAAAKSHKEAGELLADLQKKRRIKQEKTEFKNHLRQAEKGDAYAQSKTAELYLQGIGVKQDIQKGIEWYEKASETDEGYAARQLAKLYSDGELVPVDPEKAAYWRMVGGVLDEL